MIWIFVIAIAAYFVYFHSKRNGTNTSSIQKKLFPINNGNVPFDYAIQSFGELCHEIAKGLPQDERCEVVYRITIDRKNITAKMSIDKLHGRISLRKLIPGHLLANSLGWEGNEKYLEGIVQNIYLPDSWDGNPICTCIAQDFRKGCPNATVSNQFDDPIDTRTAGVIFKTDN